MTFNLSPELKLPAEAVTQTFSMLGRRGSGKTNTAVVMAEEMLSAANFIIWIDPIGVAQVAFVAKYSARGGSFNTYLSRMVSLGLIDRSSGVVTLTPAGRRCAIFPMDEVASLHDFHSRIVETIKEGPLVKILNTIIGSRSMQLTTGDIAQMTGYEAGGGSFNTYLSRLVTWGLITRKSGIVKPTELLFPAGLK